VSRPRDELTGIKERYADSEIGTGSMLRVNLSETAACGRPERSEATVLEVKPESGVVSLRADPPSRVRARLRAGFAALDRGLRSGSGGQLGVAGATRGLAQPVFTASARTGPVSSGRLDRTGGFTRDMAVSR